MIFIPLPSFLLLPSPSYSSPLFPTPHLSFLLLTSFLLRPLPFYSSHHVYYIPFFSAHFPPAFILLHTPSFLSRPYVLLRAFVPISRSLFPTSSPSSFLLQPLITLYYSPQSIISIPHFYQQLVFNFSGQKKTF